MRNPYCVFTATKLNDLVGSAITNYFFKKKGCIRLEPYNKIIKHNLVELHAIPPSMRSSYGINNSIFSTPVEKLNLKDFRKRIRELQQLIEKLCCLEDYVY